MSFAVASFSISSFFIPVKSKNFFQLASISTLLTSVARVNRVGPDLVQYPRFPQTNQAEMVIPRVLTEPEENLLSSLSVDEVN